MRENITVLSSAPVLVSQFFWLAQKHHRLNTQYIAAQAEIVRLDSIFEDAQQKAKRNFGAHS